MSDYATQVPAASDRSQAPPPHTDLQPPDVLGSVRSRIAVCRVRSGASRRLQAGKDLQPPADARMMPVFRMPLPDTESLSADKDVTKREEQIRSLLLERGPLRVLGATAGAALAESLANLYRTHPNCSAATDYVLGEEMLARQLGEALGGLRILLTGPAGVGKTDYAMMLARLLGLPSQLIAMSSAQTSSALGGSDTYWSNTKPGAVWESVIQGDFANPLFILDELEKGASHWGDPLGALYQLLEPRTAAVFRDKSVPWLEIDCSKVCWVATVNHPERLHPAIRSRFTEIAVTAPSEGQQRTLVQSLYAQLLAEFHLTDRFPARIGTASEDVLVSQSVREAKRRLRAALALALRINADAVVLAREAGGTGDRRIGFVWSKP